MLLTEELRDLICYLLEDGLISWSLFCPLPHFKNRLLFKTSLRDYLSAVLFIGSIGGLIWNSMGEKQPAG